MRFVDNACQIAAQRECLSDDAACVGDSAGRLVYGEPDTLRNDYQRDRDRILHTKAFRRLSHKTQVFLAPEGDHFRTRLTHTLEVSQIARTIARALSLNEDLTEAIALGHDLGHTPFGHSGETALTACLAEVYERAALSEAGSAADESPFATFIGSTPCEPRIFLHNEQSLRVVDCIENGGRGLNLTAEVRDGILHHTGDVKPRTLEGRIVSIADRIAYVNHDIDDAVRAGLLDTRDLPIRTRTLLGDSHSTRINTLVHDVVHTSVREGDICLSPDIRDAMMELRQFLFDNVYRSPRVMTEVNKAVHMLRELFFYFCAHSNEISPEYLALSSGDTTRAVTDYIAGMTDRFATHTYRRLFIPSALDSLFED